MEHQLALWGKILQDYADLLPALLLASLGSIVRLLLKGCSLTLKEAVRDVIIGMFACIMTFFFLYDKVGQALMFFFSCASGIMSYEFLAFLPKAGLEVLRKAFDRIKNSLSKSE